MNTAISFRKATPDDASAMHRMICALEEQEFDFGIFRAMLEQNCNNPSIHYLLAEHGGEHGEGQGVIGFISVYLQPYLHHCAQVAEIQELYVEEPFRSQSIGQRLIEKAIEFARVYECDYIEVATNKKRTDAQPFYEKHGFEQSHVKFTRKL